MQLYTYGEEKKSKNAGERAGTKEKVGRSGKTNGRRTAASIIYICVGIS